MNSAFVHLNVHSSYSLLRGVDGIREVVGRARALGFDALALTDTNGLYGAIEFIRAAREFGIKPIIGAEVVHDSGRAVCLARDRRGYANLCRLITARHLCEDFRLAEALIAHGEGLFILTQDDALLARLKGEVEDGSLFREVWPFAGSWRTEIPGLKKIPLAATNNVHFLMPEEYEIHRVLTAIRLNKLLSTVSVDETVHPEAWLRSASAMARAVGEGEALANTRRIADACNLEIEMGRPIFPRYFDLADVRERFPDETPYSALCRVALRGLRTRYRPITPGVMRRLEYELDVISRLGFVEYFLIVWDIVNFARRRKIPIMGRGSAANSLVAYTLGITNVDPLHYKLYFERFLNFSRSDCPDIDLDMCWRRRDEVLHYVYERYGADRVAMVSNHNCYQARSAFRDVARVMGLGMDEINRLSSKLPYCSARTIREAAELFPEMRDFPLEEEPYRTIVRVAEAIDGHPRHLSIHVGGIVIGDRPLTYYLPLERAAKGLVITQYEMKAVEAVGLVKIDLLGHRTLTVIGGGAGEN